MKKFEHFFSRQFAVAVAVAVMATFGMVGLAQASTTIGNDIITAGQLIVGGVARLDGGINAHNGQFVVKHHDNTEYVGIGTDDPQDSLHIKMGNILFSDVMLPGLRLGDNVQAIDVMRQTDGYHHVYLNEYGVSGFGSYGSGRFLFMSQGDSYLTGGNMGIGTDTPSQKLEVKGGFKLDSGTAKPNCLEETRGVFWFTQGRDKTADTVEVCAKDSKDSYGWRKLY